MRPPREIVAFGAGVLVVAGAYLVDMPGDGTFAALAWALGFAAFLAAPGPRGWAALLLGVVGATLSAFLLLTGSLTGGLAIFVALVLAAIASHGCLVAGLVRRAAGRGWPAAVTDPLLLGGTALAAGLLAVAWIVAAELAANPP